MMKLRGLTIKILLLFLLSLAAQSPRSASASEYDVKAAYLINFAKFVQWPPVAFTGPQAPLVIGVVGDVPFKEKFKGRKGLRLGNGRPIEFHWFEEGASAEALAQSHMLFFPAFLSRDTTPVVAAMKGKPILTVGETEAFSQQEGGICFIREGSKIRFELDTGVVAEAGLKVSAKLQQLARIKGQSTRSFLKGVVPWVLFSQERSLWVFRRVLSQPS